MRKSTCQLPNESQYKFIDVKTFTEWLLYALISNTERGIYQNIHIEKNWWLICLDGSELEQSRCWKVINWTVNNLQIGKNINGNQKYIFTPRLLYKANTVVTNTHVYRYDKYDTCSRTMQEKMGPYRFLSVCFWGSWTPPGCSYSAHSKFSQLHPRKLTWQWKIHHLKMYISY